jgi:hypothetical protein
MEQELPAPRREEMKNSLFAQKILLLAPLLDEKDIDFRVIGESKVEGKSVIGVEVTPKGGKPSKVYFDKTSHLLVKLERIGLGPTGDVKHEVYYGDFKEYNGVRRPSKVLIHHDGKKYQEATLSDVTLLEKLPEGEFDK